MSVVSPLRAIPRDDVRKRVLARLLEKFDAAKTRHKPLSLLRPELRRAAEQLLEQEAGVLGLADAEPLLEEILDEIPCTGPLEELFRDESVSEFLILAHNRVIRRAADGGWLPTSVQFRDGDHLRQTLKKFLQVAEPIGDVPKTSDGAADAKLANGFRLIVILPPRVLEIAPMAVFRRPVMAATDATPPPSRSGTVVMQPRPVSGLSASSQSGRSVDPWERTRTRITELFVQRLAANGVFDISALPLAELRRVIGGYVAEFNDAEKMHLDGTAQDRLTLEILAGMNR